jgi:hypothetical protein
MKKKITAKNLRLKRLTDLQLKQVAGGTDSEKVGKAEQMGKEIAAKFDPIAKSKGGGHSLQ